MKNKGNKILILLITIFIFAIILFAGAYAYFNSLGSLGNVIVTANVAENNSLFTSSGTDISLEVTANNMQQNANYLGVVASDTGTLNVSYLAGTTDSITCTYDMYYKWDSGEYSITDANQNEFTYAVSLDGNPVKSETNFVASSNTNAQRVNNATLSISNNSTSQATVQSYDITTKFYNIDKDQKANSDKSWKIKFYVDNIVCGTAYNLSGTIYDNNGDPVNGGTAVLFSEPSYTTVGSDGKFSFANVPNGSHTLYYVPSTYTLSEIEGKTQSELSNLANVISASVSTSGNSSTITFNDSSYTIGNFMVSDGSSLLSDLVLAANNVITSAPTLSTTSKAANETGLYSSTATTNGEPTYYFRGAVDNNNVSFAGLNWKIVRINEDGTIRIMLDSTINYGTCDLNSDGCKYSYCADASRFNNVLNWYSSTITGNNYGDKVETGNYFCKYSSTNTFGCDNGSIYNSAVGLLSEKEALFAGYYPGIYNDTIYLHIPDFVGSFWLMNTCKMVMDYDGPWGTGIGDASSNTNSTFRPVVNLKANIKATGTGTSLDPYVIK